MKRSIPALGAILCLLILAPLFPATAKDKWISVRSKNFALVGNASEKEIRQVATRLEQFRDVFTRILKKTNFNSSAPTTVVVFKNYETYKKYGPPNTSAYFQAGVEMNYIALSAINGEAENPFGTIFHEFVHLLVKDNVKNMPLWFNEGLAEYYSTFEIKEGETKVMLGKVISSHVFELRERKFIPLQMLFTIDDTSPYYNESSKQSLFYAESWALMHYFLLNPQRQPQLGRFLSLIIAGTPPDKAFATAFGTDYATIEKELREYIKRDNYPAQIATFEHKLEFDLEMQSAPLSEAEGEYYIGDMLNHAGQFAEAEKHLQKAVALDANLAVAHASLGRLEIRRKRYAEAERYLERAIAADNSNYLAHYYYAYMLSQKLFSEGQRVESIEPETAKRMRAELQKAIELAPGFADSYRLLAFINLVEGVQLDESIALLKHAIELLPGEPEFGFILGQIYIRKRDFKAAREILEPIAKSSSTETEMRRHSQILLDEIKSMEETMARYKQNSSAEGGSAPNVIVVGPNAEGKAQTPEEAMAEALERVLHQPQEGEVRVQGQLLSIDCGSKEPIFSVQTDSRTLKLSTKNFQSVIFTAFVENMGSEISCGKRKTAEDVVVVYRPSKEAKSKVDGEVVSVEFVPKAFKLKQ